MPVTYSRGTDPRKTAKNLGRVSTPLILNLFRHAGGNHRSALVALLAPVERAATQSAFVRELVESQRIFQAQRWTPREAHRFLREVSALEDSGVQVRLPDWWRGGRPARPAR